MSLSEDLARFCAERVADAPPRSVFGFDLASDFEFSHQLAARRADVEPALYFHCAADQPLFLQRDDLLLVYPGGDPTAPLQAFALDELYVFRYLEKADFYVAEQAIFCHLRNRSVLAEMELRFLSTILSFWMERRGVLALHAAGVVVGGAAAALVGSSGAGKSTLAAAVVRRGNSFLTDDVLAIEHQDGQLRGRPGAPQLRLSPEAIELAVGFEANFPRVHPEAAKQRVDLASVTWSIWQEPVPLSCVVFLQRETVNEVRVEEVPAAAAVVELLRHSFLPNVVQALGWQPRRLAILSRLVEEARVLRMSYPDPMERVDEGARFIEEIVSSSRRSVPSSRRSGSPNLTIS